LLVLIIRKPPVVCFTVPEKKPFGALFNVSLAPLTQIAVELKKTPAEALSRLMEKNFSVEEVAERSSVRGIDDRQVRSPKVEKVFFN